MVSAPSNTAPSKVWLPAVVIDPPFRLIVSALNVRFALAADRFNVGLTVIESAPVPPLMANAALKPEPNVVAVTMSLPESPALMDSDTEGLRNVVVSPNVELTVVVPAPPEVTVIVSEEEL